MQSWVPLSLSISKHRILVWPLQLEVAWGCGSSSTSPHPHRSPWLPLPLTPISPQNTFGQLRSLGIGDENCVCGGEGLEIKPCPLQWSLYRNTEDVGIMHACFISCLLLRPLVSFHLFSYRRLSSFCIFSYSTQFHNAPSPVSLVSLSTFSYRSYLQSAHTPMVLRECNFEKILWNHL